MLPFPSRDAAWPAGAVQEIAEQMGVRRRSVTAEIWDAIHHIMASAWCSHFRTIVFHGTAVG
jgi:hypothetical protein